MLAVEAVVALPHLQAQPEVAGRQVETVQELVLRVLLEHQIREVGQEVMPLA
jgi:hypothetical protein